MYCLTVPFPEFSVLLKFSLVLLQGGFSVPFLAGSHLACRFRHLCGCKKDAMDSRLNGSSVCGADLVCSEALLSSGWV